MNKTLNRAPTKTRNSNAKGPLKRHHKGLLEPPKGHQHQSFYRQPSFTGEGEGINGWQSDFSTCGALTPASQYSLHSRRYAPQKGRKRDQKLKRKQYNLRNKERGDELGDLCSPITNQLLAGPSESFFGSFQSTVTFSQLLEDQIMSLNPLEERKEKKGGKKKTKKALTTSSNLNSTKDQNINKNQRIIQSRIPDFSTDNFTTNQCKIKPKSRKKYLEDKLSGEKVAFTIFKEEDLKFLKHRVVQSEQKNTYGNEDDHQTDDEIVKGAKKMLLRELRQKIMECQGKVTKPQKKRNSKFDNDSESDSD